MSSNSTTNTKSEKIMPHLSSFRWLKQLAIIFDKKTGQHPFLKSKIFVYLIPISFSIKFKQTQNFSFSDKIGQNYKHDSSGLEIPLVALLSLKFHNFYTVKTKSMRYAIRINQWSVTQLHNAYIYFCQMIYFVWQVRWESMGRFFCVGLGFMFYLLCLDSC